MYPCGEELYWRIGLNKSLNVLRPRLRRTARRMKEDLEFTTPRTETGCRKPTDGGVPSSGPSGSATAGSDSCSTFERGDSGSDPDGSFEEGDPALVVLKNKSFGMEWVGSRFVVDILNVHPSNTSISLNNPTSRSSEAPGNCFKDTTSLRRSTPIAHGGTRNLSPSVSQELLPNSRPSTASGEEKGTRVPRIKVPTFVSETQSVSDEKHRLAARPGKAHHGCTHRGAKERHRMEILR